MSAKSFRDVQQLWTQAEKQAARELTDQLGQFGQLGTAKRTHRITGRKVGPEVGSYMLVRRNRRGRWGRRLKRFVQWCWRHRRPLGPVYVALGTLLAGVVVSSSPGGVRTVCCLALMAAAGLWWWTSPRRVDRATKKIAEKTAAGKETKDPPTLWRPIERIYAASVLAVLTGWLLGAAATGVGPPMPGLLGLATVAGGVPWWWHHRIRGTEQVEDQVEVWRDRIACPKGALPNSDLLHVAPIVQETS